MPNVRVTITDASGAVATATATANVSPTAPHPAFSNFGNIRMVKLIPMSVAGGGSILNSVPPPVGSWAGQPGNPTGFASTPAATPVRWGNGVWPGAYPGSLTSGSGAPSSGTPSAPNIVSFKDYQLGTSTLSITGHDIIFVGCRFSYNTPNNSSGTNALNLNSPAFNIQFFYCTWAPLNSFGYTTTPNPGWPMSTAAVNTVTQVANTNCVAGADGYQFGIGAYSTSTSGSFMIQCDHCECWGFGNQWVDTVATTGQQNYYDCWVHDPCQASVVGYHQDGFIGYLDNGVGPQNILVQHCTCAGIGNANAIAFQAATSPYNNLQIINNYFSGFNDNLDLGHLISGCTNLICTDNVFGTDCQWVNAAVYGNPATLFTQSSNPTNLWRRNTLQVVPGTVRNPGSTPSWTSADNGKFLWPDQTLSSSDWPN